MHDDARATSADPSQPDSSAKKTIGVTLTLIAGVAGMVNGVLIMGGGGSNLVTFATLGAAIVGLSLARSARSGGA